MQQCSKGRTDWKSLDGAAEKRRRRLRLVKANDGLFHSPVSHCGHDGFYSQRGSRKHVKNHPDWFYYFDKKPEIKDVPSKTEAVVEKYVQPPRSTKNIPSLPKDTIFAQTFLEWLTSIAGEGRSKSQADQIVSLIRKFVCFPMRTLFMMISKTLTLTFPLGPQKISAVLWRQWKPNGTWEIVVKSVTCTL